MAQWTSAAGGNWSTSANWALNAPPTLNDIVTFGFGLGSYVSTIDANFPISTVGDINLQPGMTLDVRRSISTSNLNDASANGSGTDGGLVEIGNGATLTLRNYPGSFNLYIKNDGLAGARGTFVVADMITGVGPSVGPLIMDGVNFDTTVGFDDTTGGTSLLLKNGATYTANLGELFQAGTIALAGGGIVNFGALSGTSFQKDVALDATQVLALTSTNNEIVLPDYAPAFSLSITGFGLTDKIEIAGITTVTSATYDATGLHFLNSSGGTIRTLANVTLAAGLPATLDASHFSIGTDATGTFVDLVSCFTPGTHIQTSRGEVKVEDLREGDLVMTQTNGGTEARPVVWIGRRKIDLTRHRYPWMASPIRIREAAFADNVPHRDLVLSPDHAVYIDGCLVPAKLLVNGVTIVREAPASVEYLHVECETHGIILAEGLTVETYLDTGNRAMFENAGLALLLHPEFEINSAARCWEKDACAPLTVDKALVRPLWQRLADRAACLKRSAADIQETTEDADIRLLTNGRELRPVGVRNGRLIFIVPGNPTEVTLLSRTGCPAFEHPWIDDQRQLGVAVRNIVLRHDEEFHVLSGDDPHLRHGWWTVEREQGTYWRWTNGAGVIPLPFPTRTIEIEIAMTTRYPASGTAADLLRAA
jgi:antigen 43